LQFHNIVLESMNSPYCGSLSIPKCIEYHEYWKLSMCHKAFHWLGPN